MTISIRPTHASSHQGRAYGPAGFFILIALLCSFCADPVLAEWYLGGYGGVSVDGRITNPNMPIFGQNRANALFPNPSPVPGRDYVTQSLTFLENINLKNSPMGGIRAGYFFNRFGYSWAGLEVEGFTTEPTIKAQTLPFTQNITSNNSQAIPPPNQPVTSTNSGTVTFSQARLRVSTVALNGVVRYPGKVFQPYVGAGIGLFYFQGSAPFSGTDLQPGLNAFGGMKVFVTETISLFGEFKYNRASIDRLDDVYGLKGDYSIMHLVAGLAYHFK